MKKSKDNNLRKVFQGVLDGRTVRTLYSLSRKLDIETFHGFIKQGKESSVMLVTTRDNKTLAVKIYAVESLDFKRIKFYLNADYRFENIRGNNWSIVSAWAKREFKNLHRLKDSGINCPEPIFVKENVLVMEFIGKDMVPAPRLTDYTADKKLGKKIIDQMGKMDEAGMIHGDLSQYNIIVFKNKPYIIDLSHGVTKKSIIADELFERDMENMSKYLNKIGIETSKEDLIKRVRK